MPPDFRRLLISKRVTAWILSAIIVIWFQVFDEQHGILNLLLLDASFNNLTSVGRFDADFITHLNLDHNQLTQIPRTSRSVLTLSLAYNQIETDPEENVLYYLQLIRLQLSYNRLKKLFPKFPSSLKYLYLAGNEINTIDIDSLQNLAQLQVSKIFFNFFKTRFVSRT